MRAPAGLFVPTNTDHGVVSMHPLICSCTYQLENARVWCYTLFPSSVSTRMSFLYHILSISDFRCKGSRGGCVVYHLLVEQS